MYRMSKLHLLRITANKMTLLLTADTEPQKIVRAFHYYYSTVYHIQKNVSFFKEAKSILILTIKRPQKIILRQ